MSWLNVLEVDEVLSAFVCVGLNFFVLYSDLLVHHPCGFCSSLQLALGPSLCLCPNCPKLSELHIFIYLPLIVIPLLGEFVDSVVVILMIILIYPFRIVVNLYLWLEFIYDFLWFFWLSLWCCFFFSLNGDIVDVHISCFLVFRPLKLSFSIHYLLFFLSKLHLLDQLLLIDLHLRLQIDHLNIRIFSVFIEHLPLILLQPFLRMFILGMNRPQPTVKLFLSIFQPSVVYPCIVFVQRRQLLVPNRSFLKIARKGSRSRGPRVCRLRPSLGRSCHRPHLLISSILYLLSVIAGPLIDLIKKLQLILRVRDPCDLAHHFEQFLHIILFECQPIRVFFLIVTFNDLLELFELGVIVKEK